jgi:hypothetical protein
MSHPLDSSWAKIERANHNIKRLEAVIEDFLQYNPYIATQDVNADSTEYIYRITGPAPAAAQFCSTSWRDHFASQIEFGPLGLGTCAATPPEAHFQGPVPHLFDG